MRLCCLRRLAGNPVRVLARRRMRATARSAPSFINSSRNPIPYSRRILVAQGTDLTGYVQQEFEDDFKCERLEHGFLRVRCDSCHAEQPVR